ncbi:DEHA2D18480p [Debaryomyces hansenii CBS767]|jgi:acetyl-CoA acyltransferase 1|uniref:DEHA2D18480p n=1 Tax=Debaryomyces hansenii (strain ATCC 36239 / CBS 767 / BCRC 21394 / JCM 1990 / NBRC 0083 / IGC 2968) TaxID=284592 RepID=Q6BR82_DEBHA|nr:DEHA2D18480p [Debaryomyces hansenii CBS767]CAG87462.1 DEHA2D18480p [Debaryomyces hansenii CBS767]|eukprot:XP_459288.1 DEHA2D18480p [Debaryomyces hansenii CBS767]
MSAASLLKKKGSDIVVLSALRSPVTRCVKGGNAKMYPEELLYQILKGSVDRCNINPELIDDILIGTVLQTLGGQKASALAVKSAGFPIKTTVNTVNRQCASSAQALSYSAGSILTGENQFAIAAGVESMTHDYFPHRGIPTRIYQPFKDEASSEAQNVLMPMGITSENVAKKFGISREDQDAFALQSHLKANKATESGHFLNEIIPIKARTNNEDEPLNIVEVSKDDGVRGGSTLEKLASLKPVFAEDGTTTAGNSSQISDGASAVIITTRDNAEKIGVKPIARFVGSSVAGVPSDLMGIGPSAAVPQLLNRLKVDINDIDIFELNEAFASQSLYCINKLGINHDKVNPYGGAIAIGHPLGATGGRVISTLLNGLRAQNKELGVISMCTSTGQGYAALFANEA